MSKLQTMAQQVVFKMAYSTVHTSERIATALIRLECALFLTVSFGFPYLAL